MVVARLKTGPVEIKDEGNLLKVVKEVHADLEQLVIQADDGYEIVFAPAPQPTKRRRTTPEERERKIDEDFRAAAGSWKGHLDSDEFIASIKATRGQRARPWETDLPPE